jgi:hypothetical protein
MKKKLIKGKEKILEYLNKNKYLENLDFPDRRPYTGVTISYLKHYITPELKLDEIAEVLIDALEKDEINGLHCNDINDFVFNSILFEDYGSFRASRLLGYGEGTSPRYCCRSVLVNNNSIKGLKEFVLKAKENPEIEEKWSYIK